MPQAEELRFEERCPICGARIAFHFGVEVSPTLPTETIFRDTLRLLNTNSTGNEVTRVIARSVPLLLDVLLRFSLHKRQ